MTKPNTSIYEKRIIAFVDILGFSTMIKDSENNTNVQKKIKDAMTVIHNLRHDTDSILDIQISTFSDSAVISYPLSTRSAMFYILIDIIHLQLELGSIGVMIRGGISIGDLYHKDDVVFGPAMNEAYRLENKIAEMPRVVIMKDMLVLGARETLDNNPYAIESDLKDIMKCVKPGDYSDDNDSCDKGSSDNSGADLFFVDFLRQDSELTDSGVEYFMWLQEFRKCIIEGLNRYSDRSPIFQAYSNEEQTAARKVFKKYRWLIKYWNSVVADKESPMPVPDVELDEQIRFREMYESLKIRGRYPYR